MKDKPIILVAGASASGKTTLVEDLEKKCGLKAIPSYTTRPPRYEGETGHTFVTDEEFNRMQEIIAYAETGGYRYCVTRGMLENPKYSLYVIDNSGINYLKENYKGSREMYVVYITAPLRERFDRMMKRQNDLDFALDRVQHDAVEFKNVPYDIRIENSDGNYNEAFAALCLFCKQKGVV